MQQIIVRRSHKKYAGQNTWEYEVDGVTVVEPFVGKWEAYDNAREEYPQAMIKIEGVGIFNGGSPVTTKDGEGAISRSSR